MNSGMPGLLATWSTENRLSRTKVSERSPSWIESPWLTVAPTGSVIGLSAAERPDHEEHLPWSQLQRVELGRIGGVLVRGDDAQGDAGREGDPCALPVHRD